VDTMKPTAILKKYFGLTDGQDNMGFIAELRELKDSNYEAYKWLVNEAAAELGVTPDFS
jgi:hypothetical protein